MTCNVNHKRVLESKDNALLWVLQAEDADRPWDKFVFAFCPVCGVRLGSDVVTVVVERETAEQWLEAGEMVQDFNPFGESLRDAVIKAVPQ